MSDLVERLRENCNCNLESSPCGAEDECRLAFEAAAEIERLRAVNAELVEALEMLTEWKDAIYAVAPELGGLFRAIYYAEAALSKAKGEA